MPDHGDFRKVDFEGLVIESPRGDRLIALPTAVLEVLRQAAVIRYRRGGSVYTMRVADFADGRQGGQPVTQARDVIQGQVREVQEQEGDPSPTTPPDLDDPANIPIYVKRGGTWAVKHVTRAEYERYRGEGRLTREAPGYDDDEGTQP